jgi:predicted ribosomally synthesized peptide with nif11-like leader
MINEQMNEQIQKIFSDEAFVAALLEMETPEDVQKAIADKGLELSLEDINTIKNSLSSEEGELSEDDLENVAGGSAAEIGAAIGHAIDLTVKDISKGIKKLTKIKW